jgi:hypothetical protein
MIVDRASVNIPKGTNTCHTNNFVIDFKLLRDYTIFINGGRVSGYNPTLTQIGKVTVF